MKLPPFTSLFTSSTLQKAEDYIEEVEIYASSQNDIKAEVFGSYKYHLHISWDQEKQIFTTLDCSCPYNYEGYCKHLAALLFKLHMEKSEDYKSNFEEAIILEENQLSDLNKKELLGLVQHLINLFPDTMDVVDQYLNERNHQNNQSIDFPLMVSGYLNKKMDTYGYLEYYAIHEVNHYFLTKLKSLKNNGKISDLMQLSLSLIAQINYQMLFVDDSNGTLSEIVQEAFDYLREHHRSQNLSEVVRNKIIEGLIHLLDDEDIYGFDSGGDVWVLLSEMIDKENHYQKWVEKMGQKLENADSFHSYYYPELAVKCRLRFLQRKGEEESYWKMVCQNLQYSKIRKILLEELLSRKQNEEALKIIKGGITQAQSDNHAGTEKKWEFKLLDLYKLLDQPENVVNQTRKLLHNRFDKELFIKFKSYIQAKDWPSERAKIIQNIRDKYTLCQLYDLENMLEELFTTVKNYNFDFGLVDSYFEVLMEYNKEKMVEFYCMLISNYMDRNMGRKNYRLITQKLKKLSRNGAKAIAVRTAQYFREKYPQRKAMLEELSGL